MQSLRADGHEKLVLTRHECLCDLRTDLKVIVCGREADGDGLLRHGVGRRKGHLEVLGNVEAGMCADFEVCDHGVCSGWEDISQAHMWLK